MKKIYADHHARTITGDGVEDFYWPITHKPMSEFGERFFYECADLLREWPDQRSALIYKFCVKYLIAIAGGVFQSDLLKGRLGADEAELVVPEGWLVWPHTMKGAPPPRTLFLEALRRNKRGPSLLAKLLDFKRYKRIFSKTKISMGKMEIDGLKVVPITSDVLENYIVATQRSGLISRKAKSLPEDVVFCRSDYWFSSISEEDIGAAKDNRSEVLENKLYDIILKLYAEFGAEPSGFVREYLMSLMSEMAVLLGIHYDRLMARDDLPRRLWTGTGGQVWDLMLRSAVIEKGGHVTAFDHGGGTAHTNVALVGFIELWACHEFVTFNEKQADDIRKAAKAWPKLDQMVPYITFVPSDPLSFKINPEFEAGKKPIRKIYVLSTLYDQDRGRSFAFYPDLAYVDWQARLFDHLKHWGYEVFFKPHPESRSLPPEAFETTLGIKIVKGNFEEVLQDADLFLIDYTYTSVMIPAFLTNTPIVLVDFDDLPWHEDAYALIRQRAGIVTGGFDKKNRIQIDWNELEQAIEDSTKKCNNHDYARSYYV